jgi:putative ABC transport system substrate-binding protein
LAAELVALHVNVLVTLGTAAAKAASVANGSIPIVFGLASDPVAEGLVESLNRPGRNITGVTSISGALVPKRVGLVHELLRSDAAIAFLINPENPLADSERKDAEVASKALGQRLEVLTAKNESEIVKAFAALGPLQIGGIIIASDTFYFGQMQRMATLAVQYSVPAIGPIREFATEGGLMSYGTSIADTTRQAAVYAGRILKGEKAAELPVMQPTKFDLVINLKAAKALGLTIPPSLLATADEVIE